MKPKFEAQSLATLHSLTVPVIQPSKRLDSENGVALQRQIMTTLLATSPEVCVIDMTHVEAVDSFGLHSLAAALRVAYESKCQLVLSSVQPCVRLVLEISQLDQVFEILEPTELMGFMQGLQQFQSQKVSTLVSSGLFSGVLQASKV
jgi:anti-sigma B factor antagonist